MQFWSISLQNGLKMCAFLRSITCENDCFRNRLQPVQISPVALFESMQLQPPVRPNQSSPVQFSVFFSVAWTRPADTNSTSSIVCAQPLHMHFETLVWQLDPQMFTIETPLAITNIIPHVRSLFEVWTQSLCQMIKLCSQCWQQWQVTQEALTKY